MVSVEEGAFLLPRGHGYKSIRGVARPSCPVVLFQQRQMGMIETSFKEEWLDSGPDGIQTTAHAAACGTGSEPAKVVSLPGDSNVLCTETQSGAPRAPRGHGAGQQAFTGRVPIWPWGLARSLPGSDGKVAAGGGVGSGLGGSAGSALWEGG